MALFFMGFSPEDDLENIESIIPFIDETRRKTGGMDMTSRYQIDFEFWPIEHPIEPSDEDRPVKCPMPNYSLMNDGSMHEDQFSESLRKRAEQELSKKEQRVLPVAVAEPPPPPPVRALRKRHHTLTSSVDHAISPLLRMPPRNLTIFHMLQQFNKFES